VCTLRKSTVIGPPFIAGCIIPEPLINQPRDSVHKRIKHLLIRAPPLFSSIPLPLVNGEDITVRSSDVVGRTSVNNWNNIK
jgi:hypothetical protein